MILFVHIPKTAGTSLRQGLVEVMGRNALLFDYGPVAPETDVSILKLHDQGIFSPEQVAEIAVANNIEVLCGHFPFLYYHKLFPFAKTIAFIREPLQRCYSEYLHRQRHCGYNDSFLNFIQRKEQINLQSRFIQGMPENGIVGISEYYSVSLETINNALSLSIPPLKLNCHRRKLRQHYGNDVIPSDIEQKFYEMNKDDVALYTNCLNIFETNHHGRLNKKRDYCISTVAFYTNLVIQKIRKK